MPCKADIKDLGYKKYFETKVTNGLGEIYLSHTGKVKLRSLKYAFKAGKKITAKFNLIKITGKLTSPDWESGQAVEIFYDHLCNNACFPCKNHKKSLVIGEFRMYRILRVLAHTLSGCALLSNDLAPLWAVLLLPLADFLASKAFKWRKGRKEEYLRDLAVAQIVFDNVGTSKKEAKRRSKIFVKELKSAGFKVRKSTKDVICYEGKAELFRLNRWIEPVVISNIIGEVQPFQNEYMIFPEDSVEQSINFGDTQIIPEAQVQDILEKAEKLSEYVGETNPHHMSEDSNLSNFRKIMEAVIEPVKQENSIDLPHLVSGKMLVQDMLVNTCGFVTPWAIERDAHTGRLYISPAVKIIPQSTDSACVILTRQANGDFAIDISHLNPEDTDFSTFPLDATKFYCISEVAN